MTSRENVEGDVSDGSQTREDAVVTPPCTQQSTTHEMVISPYRYDDSVKHADRDPFLRFMQRQKKLS